MSTYEDVKKFMSLADMSSYDLATIIDTTDLTKIAQIEAAAYLWENLIKEEVVKELFESLIDFHLIYKKGSPEMRMLSLVSIADDIADAIYVLSGLANALGIPGDVVFKEVQDSNMAKVQVIDGVPKIIRRADGKILKPKDWKPPNILGILVEAYGKNLGVIRSQQTSSTS